MTGPSVSALTKNECVCEPDATSSKLTETIEIEEDAHIHVAEWRLQKVQSPIELQHDESIHHDHFEPLEFHGHWDVGGDATFTNNGFTATLRFKNRELPILKGGPLHGFEYVFEQLHFHWSEDDHSGCEHIFEGQAYSMEAHAVHYNKKYADFQEAHDKHDGLAVVAFFLKATDAIENPCFSKLSTAVMDIVKINTETSVSSDCLTWIKEEAQCKGYYTYQGSLTTEPYTESVTWILYPQPIHVSREQVAHFRSLHSTPCEQHNIKTNVRPIQKPTEDQKFNIIYARNHRSSSPAP
ncbi:carbonic anhydrase 3 [Leptinotarsa decemlineata]|uniref:carbonic anhydrase 3 n=1 Tax=Leptinotarsa decemlineata TaxID=7539 RepID=UPI000C25322E|nr:carbonic anhydrase 2-like [Leptinotarsa decemlineata]